VLLSGCRCVEIDVWDGEPDSDSDDDGTSSSSSSSDDEKSKDKPKVPKRKKTVKSKIGRIFGRKSPSSEPAADDGKVAEAAKVGPIRLEPKVLHGHTLTKGTTFREVCYAIRDSAFIVSDLPVIVSLEVHASIEQQETMVEIMEDAFNGMLIQVTPEMEAMETPPPLRDLKRKILVKVKWVSPSAESAEDVDDRTDDLEQLAPTKSAGASSQSASQAAQKPSKILHSLSRHAIFTKGFSFKQFSQPGTASTLFY
jgi:hypothetical protein